MNGQCWAIAREDYLRHEPHLHHRDEVLEDVRIGQFLSGRGIPPQFADLQEEVEVWMYQSVREAWLGFRKNAYLLAGGHPLLFLPFLTLFALTFLAAPLWSPWLLAWATGTKLVADRFSRFPLRVSLLAPVSFALWTVLLVDSAVSHLTGKVVWKGRQVARG